MLMSSLPIIHSPQDRPLPRYLQIEPVGQCNLRCQMCPIQFRRDGPPHGPLAFIEFALFQQIVDQFEQLEHLHLQGLGEPMMHPRLFDMVEYAAKRGIRVTINSNLTLLDDRRAARCVTSGLDCLHVSIDGASAEIYERIRRRARLQLVLRNVQRLRGARRRANSRRPELRMVVVLMRQNMHELADLVRLAERHEFASIFVQHLCHDFGEESLPAHYAPMRTFINEQMITGADVEQLHRYAQQATEVADQLGVELRLPRLERLLGEQTSAPAGTCDWPSTGMYVSYEGLVMPCCMISTPDRCCLGDLRTTKAHSLWNSASYNAMRSALDSPTPPAICQSCSVYQGRF